jgi:membrane-associated HD superfamily phosphohydrolase
MEFENRTYTPITIGNWLLTFIITALPLIGFIMLIVWAVSADTHPSKRTWSQAALIMFGIMIALVVVIGIVGGGLAAVYAPKGAPSLE